MESMTVLSLPRNLQIKDIYKSIIARFRCRNETCKISDMFYKSCCRTSQKVPSKRRKEKHREIIVRRKEMNN